LCDLNTLINFRNNSKSIESLKQPVQLAKPTPPSTSSAQNPSAAASIKVISLSQLKSMPKVVSQSSSSNSNSATTVLPQIIKVSSNDVTFNTQVSLTTHGQQQSVVANTSSNNVKITKVVSSRPFVNNSNNVVYYNKNNSAANSPPTSKPFTAFVNSAQSPTMSAAANGGSTSLNAFKKENVAVVCSPTLIVPTPPTTTTTMRVVSNTANGGQQIVTKTTNSLSSHMPKFYTTQPKIITAQYLSNGQASCNSSGSSKLISASGRLTAIKQAAPMSYVSSSSSGQHGMVKKQTIINSFGNASVFHSAAPSTIMSTSQNAASININNFMINGGLANNNNNNNNNNNHNTYNNNNGINSKNCNNLYTNYSGDGSGVANGMTNINYAANGYYEQDEEVVVEEEEELGHAETYANYMPTKCNNFFYLV
jgi:hypothetical protein